MAQFSYQIFATVVETGSFAKAAAKLNVTPSAVSHAVSQLEREFGFPIFYRARAGVTLTADGAQLLPYIEEILSLELNLSQRVEQIRGVNAGQIRIGAFSSICVSWLPKIIQQFKEQYPAIEVKIVQGDFNEIAHQTQLGELDLGFTAMPVSEKVTVYPLINDPIYCVAPADYTPVNGSTITEQDVAGQKFILQQIDYDRDTKRVLDYYRVTQNSLTFSIDDQSILAMVEAKLGFGVLPKLALQKLTGPVKIYRFEKEFQRHLALVANRTQEKAPATQKMVTMIHDFLANEYGHQLIWQKI